MHLNQSAPESFLVVYRELSISGKRARAYDKIAQIGGPGPGIWPELFRDRMTLTAPQSHDSDSQLIKES